MNYLKQLQTSLILFGLFLVFAPAICHADMAVGGIAVIFISPLTFILFCFFIVWAVESLVIKDRLEENPKRALLASFVINLLSTILGYLALRFLGGFEFFLFESFPLLMISLFIGTFIIEGVLLSLFYSKVGTGKILATDFIMNALSYILLSIILGIGSIPILGTVLAFSIIFYLVWRLFGLFEVVRESPTGEKISTGFGSFIKYLISVILIILFFIALYIDVQPKYSARPRARDAAFKATAQSLVPAGIICCDTPDADFVIPPVNGGLICNTPPTSSEVWPDNTKIDNISITTTCQSDGSFKFHVEPGSGLTGNCTAADCTQKSCTFTGC